MGLFGGKMTFWDALDLLDCDTLSEQQKKKIIKAEEHFTREEQTACNVLLCLHKGDEGPALATVILDCIQGENLPGEVMAALYTRLALRAFGAAHEKDPSVPAYTAYLALAYEHGLGGCGKDHAKAVGMAASLRSSGAAGALVRRALKDIFPEGADGDGADVKPADTRGSEKANTAAAADPESVSPASSADAGAAQAEFRRIEIEGGDVFEGYFQNGKKNGHGKYIWADGTVYDGEWKDGRRCGYGVLTSAKGWTYEGEWKDSRMSGQGRYTFAPGSYYEGTLENGNFEGRGKRVYDGGDVYEGQWHEDKRSGHGTYTWADGDTFEGEWKDDKRCGHGKLTLYGKVPGTGEVYVKRSYDGGWLDSKEHGHGVCIEGNPGAETPDKVSEGEWVHGKRQGRFVWYFTGSGSGRYIDFYEDGRLIEGGIPYDESIKTVEDARRAKGNAVPAAAASSADGRAESVAAPGRGVSAGAQGGTGAAPADGFEWEEFSSVGELHEKILRPELFRDPLDRYLLNSCTYLEPFVDAFHEEFAGGDYAETKEMIAEILGVESGELTECIERRIDFIRGFTEKEYLLAAMYSLAYNERMDLVPYLANLACYLWTATGDGDYFNPLLDLFRMSGAYDDDDSTWLCAILRLQENGNIDKPLKPNDDGSFDNQFAYSDDVFGDLLDQGYLPGSDGKMYWADGDDGDNGDDGEAEESDTGDNVLIRYQNGDSYRGAAVGGVREGFGAYFFADGGFYRGCFHADNYEGYGMLDEGNGKVYKGLWKNDKRCGYGVQTYANGEVYRGWWKDDRFHGFGRYDFLNGAVDLGEFYNNLHEGIFLIRREGQWFGTLWQNDEIVPEPNGPEVIDIGSDSRYTGEIVRRRNGNVITRVKHGYGKYRFSHRNGADTVDGYIGEFENNAPYGSGMVIHTVGDFIAVLISSDFRGEAMPEGECRMISLTTQGTTQYAEYYVGGFHDSKCRGKGVLSLIGNKNVCDFRWYGGLSTGSMICCNSFDGFPKGDVTVVDKDGRRTHMHLND